jgi:hypothetical protein
MKVKFLILVFFSLFLISAKASFAADVNISGKVLDQKNNPVPNSTIVFTTSDGKTVKAVNADFSGSYQVGIPQGKYTIMVSAPKETSAQPVVISNREISSTSNIDFILKTPVPAVTQKHSRSFLLSITFGIFLGLIIFIVLAWLILRRRKKKEILPEPGSSN